MNRDARWLRAKNSADTEEKTSLVEKLFQFETVQSYLVPVPSKADTASPAQVAHLLPEPTLAEGVVSSAESSVEYHCNSCSVDCSRKRYHCKTQVDFDLCSDCYNEGKFDEGMSQLDFILMDSAEVPGSGGASWTDQETLLLLEALEIFRGNEWDGIAEHVATKNKAQCMLYFLQMPILDSFLDNNDFFNQTSQKVAEKDSAENVTEILEKMKISKKENANSEETGVNLADNNVSAKKDTENSSDNDLVVASTVDALYKSSVTDPANEKKLSDVNVSVEHASSFVIDVLKSAFEAVGHFPEKENTGSFTEAGNPVMALAAYFSGLVEHDDALTSCRSSLRAILDISPALLLATRHCFILPDPPSELEIPNASVSPASTGDVHQNGDDATPNANDADKDNSKKVQGDVIIEEQNAAFILQKEHQELSHAEGSSVDVPQADAETHRTTDSDNPVTVVENSGASDKMRDGCDIILQSATPHDTYRNEPSLMSSQEDIAASTEDTKANWHCIMQFQKMEAKISLIAEVDHMVLRGKELNDEIRKKLFMERRAIFASQRVGVLQSRLNQHGDPRTRLPVGYALSKHMAQP
ncbi:hypothetical protein PR202_ga30220 [Eleusine coracana subsp. coracana]|uniref:Uncharacterized protein n=1 Tax=Eleusine coracana subsp. coracana TaxID=191504 RepID=A0AAV5DQ18_ELECO|nr:hypothetical protein PR202_ga30220 [Eleusine coracana subsp. coracana]